MTYALTGQNHEIFTLIWSDFTDRTNGNSPLHTWGRSLGVPAAALDHWESLCGEIVAEDMEDAEWLEIFAQELSTLAADRFQTRSSSAHFTWRMIKAGYEARQKCHDPAQTNDKKRNAAPDGKRRLDSITQQLRGERSLETRKRLEQERDEILIKGWAGREEHTSDAEGVPSLFAMVQTRESHAVDPMIITDDRIRQREVGDQWSAAEHFTEAAFETLARFCPYGDAGIIRAICEWPEYSDREIGALIGRSHVHVWKQRDILRGVMTLEALTGLHQQHESDAAA